MQKATKWIAIILLFCSVLLALYPTASKYISQLTCNKTATEFDNYVDNIQDGSYEDALQNGRIDANGYLKSSETKLPVLFKEDLERLYKDSIDYNKRLQKGQNIYHSSDFEYPALNLMSYGINNNMYGYMQIDCIDLVLPIYLGSTEYNMRNGAAHLNMSSLPIGGTNCNTVLAGHTGYTGKTFFDNIRYLKEGDTVKIKNYFDTIEYQVTLMKNIESSDIEDIYIKPNSDLLTLMTCSNSGATRLLVICERSDT